jgi:hypothetical protein
MTLVGRLYAASQEIHHREPTIDGRAGYDAQEQARRLQRAVESELEHHVYHRVLEDEDDLS